MLILPLHNEGSAQQHEGARELFFNHIFRKAQAVGNLSARKPFDLAQDEYMSAPCRQTLNHVVQSAKFLSCIDNIVSSRSIVDNR